MHRPGPPHRPRSPLPSPRRRLRPTGHSRPSPVQDSEDTPRPPQSPRLTCVSAAGRRSGRTCWGSNPHPHPHAHRLRVAASQTGSAYCEMVGGVSLGSQSDGGVANTASSVPLPRPALPRPPPPPRGGRGRAVPGLGWGARKPRPLLPTGTTSGMDSGVQGIQERCSPGTLNSGCHRLCPWNVPPLAGPGLSALRWTVLVCGCDRRPSPGPLPAVHVPAAADPASCSGLRPPQGLLLGGWALLHGQGTGEGLPAARSLREPRPPGAFVQGSLGLETPWRWRGPPTPTQSAFFSSWSPKYKWGLGRGPSLRTPCPHPQT